MRETPSLYAICRELERLSEEIDHAIGVSITENQSADDLRDSFIALVKINREAIKIYERDR